MTAVRSLTTSASRQNSGYGHFRRTVPGSRVQIFVSEYICSGALSEATLPSSLLREGKEMLSAVIADLRADGIHVATTLDRRLVDSPELRPGHRLEVHVVETSGFEIGEFDRLISQSDATLVIAPETDGVLACRVRRVLELGARSLNCLPSAIDLCGDKLTLAQHFDSHGIATIPTRELACHSDPWFDSPSGCVMKPRDGAGSWLTFAIPHRDHAAWTNAVSQFAAAGAVDRALLQPWIPGQSLSIACLCDESGRTELFPVARQHLGGNFEYLGGEIPAEIPADTVRQILRLVNSACQVVPGLRGYVGFDVLLPDSSPHQPLIVEINPRITTSYAGYRRLCRGNIGARLLPAELTPGRESSGAPLTWNRGPVCFVPSA